MQRLYQQMNNLTYTVSNISAHARSTSPARSQAGNASQTTSESQATNTSNTSKDTSTSEVIKELIWLIPCYDSKGSIKKFMEFVDNFEVYVVSINPSKEAQLTLATAKLTDNAKSWYREHRKEFPEDALERIQDWPTLQKGLMEMFVPIEGELDSLRKKI